MPEKTFFTLIRHAHVYAPEDLGVTDFLIAGEKIAAMGSGVEAPKGAACRTVDLAGARVLPGFIDSHVHMIGGGGEGGPHTRTPELLLSKVTVCGVTTLAGLLGTDGVTRHVESLLAKARALETEGLSTYIYTGAYQLPDTPTITGSVRKDIVVIDKCIGAGEIAMSDHRSGQPSVQDYRYIAAQARVGGMISGKAGLINMHMGNGADGLKVLFAITESGEIPKTQFLPTHMNRKRSLFEEGFAWAKAGGYIDITSGINPEDPGSQGAVKPATAVREAIEAGVPLERITMSSDGNGSMPVFDAAGNPIGVGVGDEKTMFTEFRDMVKKEKLPIGQAIQVLTANVAKAMQIYPKKGTVGAGRDADFIVITEDFLLQHVWARGQQMVADGKPIVFGTFEPKE